MKLWIEAGEKKDGAVVLNPSSDIAPVRLKTGLLDAL